MRLLGRPQRDDGLLALFEESGQNVERAATLLRDMLAGFPERAELARDILLCEQEGDRITHDLIHRLGDDGERPPFRAGDAYALATALDDVVDYAEQTADSLGLYAIQAPMEQSEALAEVLVGASGALVGALAALRGDDSLTAHLVEVHRHENEGDRLSRDAIAALFRDGIDPMVVIRWKDIFELLEQAIDACETVAHILEGITLKDGR
jgi:uncharacterized protein